jgi:uncharacterized protein (DUF885 family)
MTQNDGGIGSAPDALAARLLDVILDESPLLATLIGVHDRDALMPDPSTPAQEALAARYDALAAEASDVDTAVDTKDGDERVTVDVVRRFAELAAARLRVGLDRVTVSDLFVSPAAGVLSIWPFIALDQPEHADDYLSRLRGVPAFLAATADRQRSGVADGWLPVARLARRAAEHLDRYLAAPAEDPALIPTAPAGWPGAHAFDAERERVLADTVRPAFATYRDVVRDELAPAGRPDERPGLCWLPGGSEAYAALIAYHTTVRADAESLHETGRELIAALADEYAELGARALGTTSVAETFARLRDDPALRFESGEEIIAAAQAAIARAEEAAPQWFGRVPAESCLVEPFPANEAPQSPAAAYMPGAPDGSRRGTYLVNTYLPPERFRYTAEAIAYHEAVPGHHFQSAIAQQRDTLPLLRRVLPVTAFEEGWALYTERLADEMGLYSGDVARLGMLANDSLRAGRLVVDTGLHALGWSRADAIAYLAANTPLATHEIEVEVDRYIADPGQALAYMVGRLEIRRLREDAARRLGGRFDIRAFHDVVLGGGSLPLPTLADVVDGWVGDLC